jgi:hypothetical protein
MDSERFDTITRTLASGMSRRGVLRTLSAVGAGGVLAVVGRGNVAAKKPATPAPHGGCHTDHDGSGCSCWTSGNPTIGGGLCPHSTCKTADDGTCPAEGASCWCR